MTLEELLTLSKDIAESKASNIMWTVPTLTAPIKENINLGSPHGGGYKGYMQFIYYPKNLVVKHFYKSGIFTVSVEKAFKILPPDTHLTKQLVEQTIQDLITEYGF